MPYVYAFALSDWAARERFSGPIHADLGVRARARRSKRTKRSRRNAERRGISHLFVRCMTECARLITPQIPYFIDRHGHLKAIDRSGSSRRSCPRTLNMQIKLQCKVNETVSFFSFFLSHKTRPMNCSLQLVRTIWFYCSIGVLYSASGERHWLKWSMSLDKSRFERVYGQWNA